MSAIDLDLELPDTPGAPLYERIAAAVRRRLHEERVPAETWLPPSTDLAEALGVNVNTALRAYRVLAREGLVELRRGRPPMVRSTPDHARLAELAAELVREAARLGVTRGELVALVLSQG